MSLLEGYHGLIFSKTFGSIPFAVKLHVELLHNLGPTLNPFGAFLLLWGLETFSLCDQRHCDNTLVLVRYVIFPSYPPYQLMNTHTLSWLKKHPKVAWVSYLGLEKHPYHRNTSVSMHTAVC